MPDALCPFAVQKPVPNHGGPIGDIVGCVIHVTAGEGDPYGEFANPANQVSSHFGIGNGQGGMADGALEQYVALDLTAWAEAAGNAHYVSVETEGQPTEALTAAQVATFAKLYGWLHAEYGIPFKITDAPGAAGFITHGDGGAAWGGHFGCPGDLRRAQRQTILDAAQKLGPAPAPKGGDMISDSRTGDGYWICEPDGSIWSYGDADYLGGSNPGASAPLPAGETAVGFTATPPNPAKATPQNPKGQGYIIEASGGGVYAFGTAQYHGNVAETLAQLFPSAA